MRVSEDHGGVAERSKAPVLKTGDVNSVLGFESLPLRHTPDGSRRLLQLCPLYVKGFTSNVRP